MTVKLYRRNGQYVGVYEILDNHAPEIVVLHPDTRGGEIFVVPPPALKWRLLESAPKAEAVYMEEPNYAIASGPNLVPA